MKRQSLVRKPDPYQQHVEEYVESIRDYCQQVRATSTLWQEAHRMRTLLFNQQIWAAHQRSEQLEVDRVSRQLISSVEDDRQTD
jgi:hypothetical protein